MCIICQSMRYCRRFICVGGKDTRSVGSMDRGSQYNRCSMTWDELI